MTQIENNIDHLFREFSGKMASVLLKIFGFEHANLIDDIVQDTFLTALLHWKTKGVPEYAEAWLIQVAKNKTINEIKRKRKLVSEVFVDKCEDDSAIDTIFLEHEIQDSQLRAFLACCSPDLSHKAQIMLILKTLSGFSDREIAKALFMEPESVKKAVYRARKSLSKNKFIVSSLSLTQAIERYPIVLHTLYLMFNEGYKTSERNKVIDEDLCFEAIRLTELLVKFEESIKAEGNALLALMYFSMARFTERQNELGDLISIEKQDRTKWDQALINRGFVAFSQSRSGVKVSRYHLESTIAATHISAPAFEETDWSLIEYCYTKLLESEPTLSIKLSHAISIGYSREFEKGIELLKQLEKEVQQPSYLLMAAFAKLYKESGKLDLSRSYYQVAIDLCTNNHDLAFLNKQLIAVLA